MKCPSIYKKITAICFSTCLIFCFGFEPIPAQAWGGVGRYGLGGYGYGRLLRWGVRDVNRGIRRTRRQGRFSHNHNRLNNTPGNSVNNNNLWGRAQNRFDNRHGDNQFWQQSRMNPGQGQAYGNGANWARNPNIGRRNRQWGQNSGGRQNRWTGAVQPNPESMPGQQAGSGLAQPQLNNMGENMAGGW